MAADAVVLAWVREDLTGDEDSATPTDARVERYQSGAIQDLVACYPCLGAEPLSGLSEPDLANFQEALGHQIAARIVGMPGGQEWAQRIVRLKQGQVDITYASESGVVESAKHYLESDAQRALNRITCIRALLVEANQSAAASGLFALVAVSPSRCGCLE